MVAMGTVKTICYAVNQSPPALPVAEMVLFDRYTGPTLIDGSSCCPNSAIVVQ